MTDKNINKIAHISSIQPLESKTSCNDHSSKDSCCIPTENTQNEHIMPDANATQSRGEWYISGMDCPSCAGKIETAVSKVPGVDSVKVLFATEKLVVNFSEPASEQQIENACIATGFKIQSMQAKSLKDDNSKQSTNAFATFFSENFNIIGIAAGMLIAAVMKTWSPQLSQWLFTLTCLLGLVPVLKSAYRLTKSGSPFAIETLMSVAALGALYLGETAEAAMVLLLFLIGERLEGIAASRARSGVQALMALVPENTIKIVDGQRMPVAVAELIPGDIIEVSPGSRLPADGQLLADIVSIDASALTGESVPVEHQKGDNVMAGSIVVDRVVRFKITSKQGENAIDRILHLIEDAESRKAPLERFLDKFSRWYTPLMMVVALLVIIIPPMLFSQPWETWVYRGLALLLIACPCALVISTPATITSGLATAAKRGALIKGGAALEQLGKVEVMAFDKTGTLTQGKPQVTDVVGLGELTSSQVLSLAAAIEMGSTHPLATSLIEKAKQDGIDIIEASNKTALVGVGVRGEINDSIVQISSPSKLDIELDASITEQVHQLEDQGKTVVVVSQTALSDNQDQMMSAIGIIAWQDTIREDAKQALNGLDMLGIKTIMLTGDNPRSAEAISQQLSFNGQTMNYQASLLPKDKVQYIEQLSKHSHVAMVGDGINDAPAMKAANVSVAMGAGTDVALETADSALTHNRLTELPRMIELSRATLTTIHQNVTISIGLKAVFLVTSLLGITGLWVAVLADSGATALVTLNALRLLKFKPKS